MFKQVLDTVTPDYESKVDFYKVNIDEEPNLPSTFNIKSIPTIVRIFLNGKVTMDPGMDANILKHFLDGLLSSNKYQYDKDPLAGSDRPGKKVF